jgi:hypothetical protein
MGSPESAVIANFVMEDVEQRALASVSVSLSFWKRFVDDVISAISRNEIDILLQHLNSIEPSIQFTVEREIDGHAFSFFRFECAQNCRREVRECMMFIANPHTETNICHTTVMTQ